MIALVRKCPGCKEEHSEDINICPATGFDLTLVPLGPPGQKEPVQPIERLCSSGHHLQYGDEICLVCGKGPKEKEQGPPERSERIVDGWRVIDDISKQNESYEQFIVERHDHRSLLTLYRQDMHPDPAIYEVFKRLPKDFISEIQTVGEWQGRSYEIAELTREKNLLAIFSELSINVDTFHKIVKSMGRILSSMEEAGLRHLNIRPENILVRSKDSLDLTLTGFHYARLSSLDLDSIPEPVSAHYLAPEVIAGGVSVASDWWSLGMVLLQLATRGNCFDGSNEKAFRIHVVTRGVSIPKGLEPEINLLLRGLLARDPDKRWRWTQIQGWLAGEPVEAPDGGGGEEEKKGPSLELNGRTFLCPKAFALAGAVPQNWEAGRDLLMRGVIANWLEVRRVNATVIAGVRLVASLEGISDDFRYSLSLMWLNSDLPLIFRGEIINPAWLLQNPTQGYEIITGLVAVQLRQMNREQQICELSDRIKRAREKAKVLEIELDEERFRILSLTVSRNNLEKRWEANRRLFPGSDHAGLNSLLERQKLTDEDLIILLGAVPQQYLSAEQILTKAVDIASQAGIKSFDKVIAEKWFENSRRDLFRAIEARLANFAKCGISRVDEWADEFRINRRIALPRALVLLAVPYEIWKEPPGQQKVAAILDFFEKRSASVAQRGPFVRLLINKTSPRIDVSILGSKKQSAASIVEYVIGRTNTPFIIERNVFEKDPNLERRFRHLVRHAKTFRRDTGIDSLYLGFPFLIMRDNSPGISETKPRIAPILLWPIRIDLEDRERVSIYFDQDREEVRLNPALYSLLGIEEAKRWNEIAGELLGRSSLRMGDVIDAYGSIIEPRERVLCEHPNKDYKIKSGVRQLVCSAVFFHAEFMGQAISEDLRQLRRKEPAGTGLETALRLHKDYKVAVVSPAVVENDRYLTMESDPSQENAVFQARLAPGLLIEGPPGTGKSQTIVNIVADSIGRKQTVLVVCQKQPALEVLAKRLDAEGFSNRFFFITNVNKDRKPVIEAIRNQIDSVARLIRDFRTEDIDKRRRDLARKIEKLEREIDQHHIAIHRRDESTGLSYRSLIAQLIELEYCEPKLIDVPALRELLRDCEQSQLSSLEDVCAPLASVWLESRFEGSPLARLRPFSSDAAYVNEFIRNLNIYIEIEKERNKVNRLTSTPFDVEDPEQHQAWICQYHNDLSGFKEVTWKNLSKWRGLFRAAILGRSREAIRALEEMKNQLSDFVSNFVAFAQSEDKRDKINGSSAASFEIEHLLPHRSWIDEYDKLLRNMNDAEWKNLSAWFDLFFSKTQSIPIALEIIEKLKKIKQQLSSLRMQEIDPRLSEKLVEFPISAVNKWNSLADCIVSSDLFLERQEKYEMQMDEFVKKFSCFIHAEDKRDKINSSTVSSFEICQISPHRLWIEKYDNFLRNMNDPAWKNLSAWFDIFDLETQGSLNGLEIIEKLEKAKQQFFTFNVQNFDSILLGKLTEFPISIVNKWNLLCSEVISPNSFFSRIWLIRVLRTRRLHKILSKIKEEISAQRIIEFQKATELERNLRPIRISVLEFLSSLHPEMKKNPNLSAKELEKIINQLLQELRLAAEAVQVITSCPCHKEAVSMARMGSVHAYLELLSQYVGALSRCEARDQSLQALDCLGSSFETSSIDIVRSNIEKNYTNFPYLKPIIECLAFLKKELHSVHWEHWEDSIKDLFPILTTDGDSYTPALSQLHDIRYLLDYCLKNRQIFRVLVELKEDCSKSRIKDLRNAAKLEIELRPLRIAVLEVLAFLHPGMKKNPHLLINELGEIVNQLLQELQVATEAVQAVINCPRRKEAEAMARLGSAPACLEMLNQYMGAFSRYDARDESRQALDRLSGSFADSLQDHYRENIERNNTNLPSLQAINECLPFLEEGLCADFVEFTEDKIIDSLSVQADTGFSENVLISMRKKLFDLIACFFPSSRQISALPPIETLYQLINAFLKDLRCVETAVLAIQQAPLREEVKAMAKIATPFAYKEFFARYEEAFRRHTARSKSIVALEKLSTAFTEDFFASCKTRIQENVSNISKLEKIVEFLPSLSAYQEFRLQVPALSEEALKVFAILREKENELKVFSIETLDDVVRRLIAREGRLAWKNRLELNFPVVRLGQKELSLKIDNLDKSAQEMQKFNRRFLSLNIDIERLGEPRDWEDITRLQGPRARRLREIVEMGSDIGLLQLRPVWLMNPDTASQMLPLRAGMFDVVIFDEASQIPVENALPTLFRGKRAVISGDEKQMPPNNAFRKRYADDDGDLCDIELGESASEAEREEFEATWNQREIKDCPDLLTLGKTILPKTMLEIHYRSKYRELIAFSNAAFYNGQLNVPVRHPDHVIRNVKPIEVVRVLNGIYEDQTNRAEAEKVVDLLTQIWASPNRPSIGVVTFNAKQADLIEDVLDERAENNPTFSQALSNERTRIQDGEDMCFFVKNVENVQGDERDMIIFSSTFGRDEEGKFRRQFGLLSQVGGERRLNVAITRAREKVILVTSLPINEISDALSKRQPSKIARDYLQAYFDYASKVSDGSLELARSCLNIMTPASSAVQISSHLEKDGFMRSVAEFIEGLGIKPLAVAENDAFGLDFVIEDKQHKRFGMGIECDAHRHPLLETARAREIWRAKVLRKIIPYVHRITSYGWYHRREEEMERLKQAIEKALVIT